MEQPQRVVEDALRHCFMRFHLVDGPEHSVNFDSIGLGHCPQGAVARQQDAVPDFFSQHQCKAVVEFKRVRMLKCRAARSTSRPGSVRT